MSKRSKLSMIVGSGTSEEGGQAREFRKKTYRLGEWVRDAMSLALRGQDIFGIWARKRLDPAFREELMVAVARANQCRYCNYVHSFWALRAGLSEKELQRIKVYDPKPPDNRDRVAVAYVQELSRLDFGPVPKELRDLMSAHFNPRECADIETVARFMTLFNRSGNTLDAMLSRMKGAPSSHSGISDELVIGAAFLAALPGMILSISALQGRSPLSVVRDFQAFSRRFEQEIAAASKPRLRSVKPASRKGRVSA